MPPFVFARQPVRLTAPEERGRPLSLAVVPKAEGGGLATLAGGWKGSADFVRTLAKLRRSGGRRLVRLDS